MGFGLGAIASVVGGGVMSGIGNYKAAQAEKKWAGNALDGLQQEKQLGRDKAQELYGGYLPANKYSMDSLGMLRDVLVGGDMSKFYNSPGYQFRMDQGTKAVDRGMAARGMNNSSRALRGISDYAQGTASSEYGNFLQNLMGFSAQAGNTGMAGTNQIMSQYGGVSPAQIAQATLNLGNAKAAAVKSPWESASTTMGAAGGMMNQANQNQQMMQMMGMGGVH